MGSTRRRFTDEHKAQAVAFVIDGDLGDDPADKPLDPSERAELERLRAENAELQMQVEFAKEVATWPARGKQ